MKKVFALLLALLMLTTNVGITIAAHYCGGMKVKTGFSLGKSNLSCGMTSMDQSCENHNSGDGLHAKNCCENESLAISIEDNYDSVANAANHFNLFYPAPIFYTSRSTYDLVLSTQKEYLDYSPPFLDRDIPVLVQSFLL